jgi:UDP-3-O-[3-hydroxymyristoyl] glucosamine N-acyltransferase
MRLTVEAIAKIAGAEVVGGEGTRAISGVAEIDAAGVADLVFVEHEKDLDRALASRAGAVIAGEFASARASARGPAVLACAQPKLGFVRAAAALCPPRRRPAGVHRSADVDASVALGVEVAVAERVSIDKGACIGDRTQIGPGTVVGADVSIGPDCDIKANVVIYPGTRIGTRVVVHAGAVLGSDGFGFVPDKETGRYEKFPQVGWLEIGNDVEIGANVAIDRGALGATVIADGVKLDNLVHLGHNVHVGRDVVMAAQVGIAGSSVVEDSVMLGGQVGIGDHARIGEGAMLGGQAGVPSGKILRGKGVVFWGTPAKPLKQALKELAVLARLAKNDGE